MRCEASIAPSLRYSCHNVRALFMSSCARAMTLSLCRLRSAAVARTKYTSSSASSDSRKDNNRSTKSLADCGPALRDCAGRRTGPSPVACAPTPRRQLRPRDPQPSSANLQAPRRCCRLPGLRRGVVLSQEVEGGREQLPTLQSAPSTLLKRWGDEVRLAQQLEQPSGPSWALLPVESRYSSPGPGVRYPARPDQVTSQSPSAGVATPLRIIPLQLRRDGRFDALDDRQVHSGFTLQSA